MFGNIRIVNISKKSIASSVLNIVVGYVFTKPITLIMLLNHFNAWKALSKLLFKYPVHKSNQPRFQGRFSFLDVGWRHWQQNFRFFKSKPQDKIFKLDDTPECAQHCEVQQNFPKNKIVI